MYGMTYEELLAAQQTQSVDPLRVWWRPVQPSGGTADSAGQADRTEGPSRPGSNKNDLSW
jgi:hypothetical protein